MAGFPKPWPVLCCTVGHVHQGTALDKQGGSRLCAFEGACFSLALDSQGCGLGSLMLGPQPPHP